MGSTTKSAPHIALFPCAGMGHLIPFLRLAAMLHSRGCTLTLITVNPTVSAAESDHLSSFFANYPHIKRLQFQLLPHKNSGLINDDPFFIQMESIANSVHLLHPLLSSVTPPLSAVVADFIVTARIADLASNLSIPIPTYTLVTTSARFFSLMTYLPHLLSQEIPKCESIQVPGLGAMDLSSIPPIMTDPNSFFSANITSNSSSLSKVRGVLINTFTEFESEAIRALRSNGIDQILPIGPLESFETENNKSHNLPWLDEQGSESVILVSFGSRTALSLEQTQELGAALEKSGVKFLWVLKGGKVDREDTEGAEEILGRDFVERTKTKGMIVKGWVNQEKILAHPAIGGFVSHCGWNSVVEAARLGVPVVAWPQHGDQRVNAEVVEKAGLGVWGREWGWGGTRLIGRDEIAEKLVEVMQDGEVRARAKEVKERARRAREAEGSSELLLRGLIQSFKV